MNSKEMKGIKILNVTMDNKYDSNESLHKNHGILILLLFQIFLQILLFLSFSSVPSALEIFKVGILRLYKLQSTKFHSFIKLNYGKERVNPFTV